MEEEIGKIIFWLNTMEQKKGYGGPVVHYWQDSLNYIGPGIDWRYEGLINSYITLLKKTGDQQFFKLAIRGGNHIISSQLDNGNFLNSGFEANPVLGGGAIPHETAVCLALVDLIKLLKENKFNWDKYFEVLTKNIELYHFNQLFDKKTGLFFQYKKKYALKNKGVFVPNKIATIIELLLEMHELTKNKLYLKLAIKNGNFIISQQNEEEFAGGIYQTELKEKIITYYTARCIPALLKLFDKTKDQKYVDSAINAIKFIKKMENEDGGFCFGYQKKDDEFKLYKYPIFVAGAGDILRSIKLTEKYEKYNIKKHINWLMKNIDLNGGIRTSIGMNLKNKKTNKQTKLSWKDVIHVVGWNDKSLRFFSELIEKDTEINIGAESEVEINCLDGIFYENEKFIQISGNRVFDKKRYFSSGNETLKRFVMNISLLCPDTFTLRQFGSSILHSMGVK
ncbi:MAG: hypothetical protein AB1467_05585 [Candidatus Diapherotrites archaeon]